MIKKFSELELKILRQVAVEVENTSIILSGGKQYSKLVIEVKHPIWYDWVNFRDYDGLPEAKTPDSLIGTWVMAEHCDTRLYSFNDWLRVSAWVKCKQVEQVVKVWEEIDE